MVGRVRFLGVSLLSVMAGPVDGWSGGPTYGHACGFSSGDAPVAPSPAGAGLHGRRLSRAAPEAGAVSPAVPRRVGPRISPTRPRAGGSPSPGAKPHPPSPGA